MGLYSESFNEIPIHMQFQEIWRWFESFYSGAPCVFFFNIQLLHFLPFYDYCEEQLAWGFTVKALTRSLYRLCNFKRYGDGSKASTVRCHAYFSSIYRLILYIPITVVWSNGLGLYSEGFNEISIHRYNYKRYRDGSKAFAVRCHAYFNIRSTYFELTLGLHK
jgi:hypothetical protein